MIIGIDFDNTIVLYDKVFYNTALELKLIDPTVPPVKFIIRDKVRSLPNGEMKWRMLQAIVYGKNIQQAEIAPGFLDFIIRCKQRGYQVYVISHKTRYALLNGRYIDLHTPAVLWIKEKGLLTNFGLKQSEVFFLETRKEKLDHIKKLKCCVFIDDLIEIFLEPGFPINIVKLLYNPHKINYSSKPKDIIEIFHWRDVEQRLFS